MIAAKVIRGLDLNHFWDRNAPRTSTHPLGETTVQINSELKYLRHVYSESNGPNLIPGLWVFALRQSQFSNWESTLAFSRSMRPFNKCLLPDQQLMALHLSMLQEFQVSNLNLYELVISNGPCSSGSNGPDLVRISCIGISLIWESKDSSLPFSRSLKCQNSPWTINSPNLSSINGWDHLAILHFASFTNLPFDFFES
jgi:hypothetical protein